MRKIARGGAALLAVAFAVLAWAWLTLPDVRRLRTENPKTTAFMELRERQARARGEAPKRDWRWVPYERISHTLKRAVLVAEDAGFWEHEGVDLEALQRAMEVNLERREFALGASTITQQLAKNLYLSPSKNPLRKLREIWIARRVEIALPKRRILELYLNSIEWGDGIYGAEAASRAYFGKPASALGADESALLAGSIINPRVYSPGRPNARLLRRQRLIRTRMGAFEPPPSLPAPAPASPPAIPLAAPALPSALPGAAIALPPPPPPKKPGGG
ncbi:MAG: monofunctional biosynthetic peptidoglycan transglycosylase [Acidobacteriota bacterium]|nr:monofunctional biosynthetic peptidoglycan transglycosylase [Acidobacteriota bacterium]